MLIRKNTTDSIVANLYEAATFKNSLAKCIGSIDFDYITANNSFYSDKADISTYPVVSYDEERISTQIRDVSDKVCVSTTQENVSDYSNFTVNTGESNGVISNYGTYYVNNPWYVYNNSGYYWFGLDTCSCVEENKHTERKYLIDANYTDVRVICATSRYKRRFFINI